MPNLTPFWRFLDARSRPEAVLSEWRERLGSCFDVIRPLLQPVGKTATSYPNPRPHGLPLRVVRHRDGSVVAVCPEGEGTRIELTGIDLAVFALDFGRLRPALAQALELATSRVSLEGKLSVLPIGRWEPKPGAAFPVTLVRVTSVRQAREFIHPLVTTASKPTLVLTPTREHWPDDVQAFCEQYKCVAAPLDEIITADGTSLVAGEQWHEYLEALCRHARLTLASNYQNRKPPARRASLMAMVEKVKKALIEHIYSARDGVVANLDAGNGARLVKFLTKTELARLAGLEPYHVTRCFQADPQLDRLYQIANDPEQLLQYGK